MDSAKDRSRAIWDEMAPGWERNKVLFDRVGGELARVMVEALDPRPGQTILDLAAGPGETGFLAAERVGPAGTLISTDFAPEMVEVAARAAKARGLDNVETRTLDAEAMDLPADSVDGIVCRWGFMLMLEPAAAMRESRRVLRDGGRLVLAVWGSPARNQAFTIPARVAVEQGLIPLADPDAPGSVFSLADEGRLRASLTDAGFTVDRIEGIPVHWTTEGDFESIWSFYTELAGAVAALVKVLPLEQIETYRDALRAAVEEYRTPTGYSIPSESTVAVAS
jgi:SAM-dependent methyltransferase